MNCHPERSAAKSKDLRLLQELLFDGAAKAPCRKSKDLWFERLTEPQILRCAQDDSLRMKRILTQHASWFLMKVATANARVDRSLGYFLSHKAIFEIQIKAFSKTNETKMHGASLRLQKRLFLNRVFIESQPTDADNLSK